MPRRKIQFVQHQYYHIYNRGAGRHNLFIEKDNYLYVLRRTKKYSREFNLAVIAYCLLPNHYHFLIRQDGDSPTSELPKRVFGGYSRAVQRRYDWTGTLFEGRFQAKLVYNDNYLLHLCRYIHANPVITPKRWPYSNYLEWVGLRGGTLIDRWFVDTYFPHPGEYRSFVEEYISSQQLPDDLEYLKDW